MKHTAVTNRWTVPGFSFGPLSPLHAILVTFAVTGLSLLLRLFLDTLLGGQPTLIIFALPIMISAYVGGVGAGLLATALTFFVASYYLLPPLNSFAVASGPERWQQLFLALTGVVISVLNELLHRARHHAGTAIKEQRKSDEALRNSIDLHAKRISGIVDSAMDAIISLDSEQRVILFNVAAERMFGCPAVSALGQPLDRFIPARARQTHAGLIKAFGTTGETSRSMSSPGALTAQRSDGSEFPIEASISHINVSGQTFYTVILRDVSLRLMSERKLIESEERLYAVTENLSEGLLISDLQGNVIHWNLAGLRMHGYHDLTEGLRKLSEFVSTFSITTITGEPIPVACWPLSRLLAGELVKEQVVRVRRIDSDWTRVFSYSGAVLSYAGDQRMAFLSINDITERHQSSMRLQAQLHQLQLLDQITRSIGERHDLLSIYQVAARTLEQQLPVDFCCVLELDDDTGLLIAGGEGVRSELLTLERGATFEIGSNGLSDCIAGKLLYEPVASQMEYPLARCLASGGLESVVIAPLRSESRVFGVLIAARSKTHGFASSECEFIMQLSAHIALAARQAQLHSELQTAFNDLRQAQQAVLQQERLRALGQMASGIAHDINNAITPATLYASTLLEDKTLNSSVRHCVQIIARSMDDVAATVARMREFYRSREPQLKLTPLALNELAQDVIELARARWSDMPLRRGVVITVKTEFSDALPQLFGVASEIREALINLVFNAVDAMPDGGVITVSTRTMSIGSRAPAGDLSSQLWVALEVADTGIGMDEATRRRCLEPFFTTKGERGTGLGLAMVYGTVQRHGAVLEIETAPGTGTLVRIAFPVRQLVPVAPVASIKGPIRKLSIMLIDDDAALLQALRDSLEWDEHTIQTVNGGQAGIDAFAAACDSGSAPDVVITDLGMPHVDGRAVAAAIKRRSPTTPIILLTGWGQRMAGDGEAPAEVDIVLSKPPQLAELREALARCTQLQSLATPP